MGGYDLEKYAKGPLTFHKLSSDQFWEMPLHRVRAGDLSFKPVVQRVMADSGTSLNLMPEHDYKKIYNHFFKGKFECKKLKNTLTMCDCTKEQHEAIPDIHFTLDGTEYKIDRDQWFERAPRYNKCVIKLMHGPNKPYWILGLNFFTNYYTVFDYKNKQIGFAESINMGKPMNKGFINWCLSSAGILEEDNFKEEDPSSVEETEERPVEPKVEDENSAMAEEQPVMHHHHNHRRHRHHHHNSESAAEPGMFAGYTQLGAQMMLLALTTMVGWAVFALCWCQKRSAIDTPE